MFYPFINKTPGQKCVQIIIIMIIIIIIDEHFNVSIVNLLM